MKQKSSANIAPLIKDGTRLKYLLEECEYGTAFKHLSNEQWKEMWDLFYTWLKQNHLSGEDLNLPVLEEAMNFIALSLDTDKGVENTANLLKPMKFLLSKWEGTEAEGKYRTALCRICEKWLLKEAPAIPDMDCFVFRHLLMLTSNELSSANIKRLNKLRNHWTAPLLLEHAAIINKLIQNPKFMEIEAGKKFFMYTASQSTPIFNRFFSTITLELRECSKETAEHYGRTLMLTWKEANAENKVLIAAKFQELMEEFLKLKRLALGLPKHSANILSLIDVWNKEVRQKTDQVFTTMITNCYQPILWKYFEIGHNFQRCNAADLFYKAFPLSLIDDPDADSELFSLQVDYMEKTLKDDCHITRIIAVREICNILAVHWAIFSDIQINRLMKIIAKEEVCDSSSAEVRRMVWRGFESLLTTDLACSYLQKVLPNLKDYLYDVNATVRVAFVKLLIAIRELKKPGFLVSSIVSPGELFKCLQYEESAVGVKLSQLLMPKHYSPDYPETKWIMKFCAIIQKYPYCYRNFFFYSKQSLKFADALEIMCKLIENLGSFVMKKLRAANEENDSSSANVNHSRQSFSESRNTEASSIGGTYCAYDDPKIAVGLLEIVAILWVLHSKTLQKKPAASKQLINTYLGHAQHFIRYYKNTPVFQTVIHLTGNVPMNILTQNSITLNGYCLKMFKAHRENHLDEDSTLTMISALVKWGRGSELLEMITLWLEAALKPTDDEMLESKIKRVKISDEIDPDSLLAVSLLNKILESSVTRVPTLEKNYNNLFEIFNLMDKIKPLIFVRLLRGTPYTQELLSDEFLFACYRRYVKLIPLLRHDGEVLAEEEKDHLVDSPQQLRDLIAWIQDDLIPMLHTEQPRDLPLITMCINEALEICESMLKVNYIDHEEFDKFEQVITSLMTLDHSLHFVKASSRLTATMSCHSKLYLMNNHMRVWLVIIPNILSRITNALVISAHSQEDMSSFHEDLRIVGASITKTLECYEHCFRAMPAGSVKDIAQKANVIIQGILNCARAALSRNIMQEDFTISSYSSVASSPAIAAALLVPLNSHPAWSSICLREMQDHIGNNTSVKNLLIDLLIIHLFKKCENKAFKSYAKSALQKALIRLENFKNKRRSEIRPSISVGLVGKEPVNFTEELGTLPNSAVALSRESGPCSNAVTVGTEPRESEMMDCDQPSANKPLSQTAVSGSQPNEPQPLPSDTRASTMSHLPEEELLADVFINHADELLKVTMEFFNKDSAPVKKK